ncbi:polyphosphate polymerase domain-containing protein [Numidum massiliense]|uniref:polyphosphate polymerase domain-containing protein n=1 Tax=Numidum massiliense TaxID=1522315 RepID=UPI0006D56103|nr:polyphosphate polymerase domain-containing protein [Numidum massiliense]
MAIEIFRRREQKYLLTREQYAQLVHHMSPFMRPDQHGKEGCYTVTSLYFDSWDQTIYFETKNKLKFRQKLRLRVYDDADIFSDAFFEVKQKHKSVVNKRRIVLPLKEAYHYLTNGTNSAFENYHPSNPQGLREIHHFKQLYELEPEMVVSYNRHALHCKDDPDLRVTFDSNLRCRREDLRVDHGPYGDNFVDPNVIILEVKVSHSVPLWLTRMLQNLNCEQKSISKFCTSMELLKPEVVPNEVAKELMKIGSM